MANEFISQLGVLKTATPAKERRLSALTSWSGILRPCAVINKNQAKGLAAPPDYFKEFVRVFFSRCLLAEC